MLGFALFLPISIFKMTALEPSSKKAKQAERKLLNKPEKKISHQNTVARAKYSQAVQATKVKDIPVSKKVSLIPNEKNIYLLARVIHAEARGEPFEGQVAVGAVLLNRLRDVRFPKTISQIIFKHGEFCTVRDGQIWMIPSQRAIKAARLATSGWDPTGGAVYFYNPAKTTSRWIWSRTIIQRIGNHFFAV